MPRKKFSIFELFDATQSAVPTILAYDRDSAGFVIGEEARRIAAGFRPVVQDFKLMVGESDPMFEGRFVSQRGVRPQRLWEVRPEAIEQDQRISTKQALKLFLQELFKDIGDVPEQLIVGVPSTTNEAWLRQYRTHVIQVLAELGHPDPQFFPEPFAVFQYYRDEGLIPAPGRPLTILVIDFGGGTLDSCVIETTPEGNLARGGSTRVPLGIHSVGGAGKAIDRKLVALAVAKNKDPRLKQDAPESRIAARPWVLLAAEEMKIALSRKMQMCRLEQDCKEFAESRTFPPNWYHPDVPVQFELDGNDLKQVLCDLWFDAKNGFGPSILATVQEAKFRGGVVRLERMDKVILAGGSSGLPFLRELLLRTLAGQIETKPEDIVVGENCERAVAYGIAIEAAEERNRSLRTHNSIGPCVFSELFLYSAPRRREPAIKPEVTLVEGKSEKKMSPGVVLPGAMRLGGFELEYKVDLPYRPHGSLLYWFTDKQNTEDPEGARLNIEQDIVRVPPKSTMMLRMKISFDDARGMITPTFIFGKDVIPGAPFVFGGLRLAKDVQSYAGIDLGTSNSYAVKLWASPKSHETKYPEFGLSEAAGATLRKLEEKIQNLRAKGVLTSDAVREFSKREETDFIFHSIKIEGSSLTKGATEDILSGRVPAASKETVEPINVRAAYEFAILHADYIKTAPGLFLRELNKVILQKIDERGGSLRAGPVKISGMEYQPPDAMEVPSMVDRLAEELKAGPGGKSIVQFAAEMHSKLTAIHPFVDGNGRTARLLLNAILLDSILPPIVINHSDKQRYLDCLAVSNKGDISDMCILVAESLQSCLEIMSGVTGHEVPIDKAKQPQIKRWVPSQELAEIMEKKLAKLPVNRKARYEAWCAGFEALREEFRSTFLGFNETYGDALYHVHLARFDTLPFEKYETLLRRAPASWTWLMSATISSDIHAEKFVFPFRTLSQSFLRAARSSKYPKLLPPTDVTLGISRWVSGSYQFLREEPLRLREIGYINGEWLFLLSENGVETVQALALSEVVNMFLRDAITAFL
ncbi:MAG TPA: Fic family protein [Terriglobales bacterium]